MKHGRRIGTLTAVMALSLLANPLLAKGLQGVWWGPMGKLRVTQKGSKVRGVLVKPSKGCGLKKGQEVLNGALMEDNLAGQLTVCQSGKGCAESHKAFVILLVAKSRKKLTGALHLPKPECSVAGQGKGRGLRLSRIKTKRSRPEEPKQSASTHVTVAPQHDGKADPATLLTREGHKLLLGGKWLDARQTFKRAIAKDPARSDGYNGVGVTFYGQKRYTEALLWYKKALEVDPDYGDAYYNLACIYALEGKKKLAMRYIKISVLNSYLENITTDEILSDPDLASIRDEPEFRALLGLAPSPSSAPADSSSDSGATSKPNPN